MISLPENVPSAFKNGTKEYVVFPVLAGMKFSDCYRCWIHKVPILRTPKYGFNVNSKHGGWAVGRVSNGQLRSVLSDSEARNLLAGFVDNHFEFNILGG